MCFPVFLSFVMSYGSNVSLSSWWIFHLILHSILQGKKVSACSAICVISTAQLFRAIVGRYFLPFFKKIFLYTTSGDITPSAFRGLVEGNRNNFFFHAIDNRNLCCLRQSFIRQWFSWLYVTESVFFITWNMRECLRQLIRCSAYDFVTRPVYVYTTLQYEISYRLHIITSVPRNSRLGRCCSRSWRCASSNDETDVGSIRTGFERMPCWIIDTCANIYVDIHIKYCFPFHHHN